MNADAGCKLDGVSCEKCGSKDIRWCWHETNYAHSRMRTKACGYSDTSQPSGEHIHGHCQVCHFDFFEDVA